MDAGDFLFDLGFFASDIWDWSESSNGKPVLPPTMFFWDSGTKKTDKSSSPKKYDNVFDALKGDSEEIARLMGEIKQDGVFNSLEERANQRFSENTLSSDEIDAFLFVKDQILKNKNVPMIGGQYTIDDAGKDAVIDAMIHEATLVNHPFISETHLEMPAYAAMMKALGENLKEKRKPLTDEKKKDLRLSVATFVAEKIEMSSEGKKLPPKAAQHAAAEIYDALGSDNVTKYNEIIDSVAKKTTEEKDKKSNRNLMIGGGLVVAGLVAHAAGKSAEKKQEPTEAGAEPKKKKGSGLSFVGTTSIVIGAVVAGWALWSKYGPSAQGKIRA
jgi:hypothetical protein